MSKYLIRFKKGDFTKVQPTKGQCLIKYLLRQYKECVFFVMIRGKHDWGFLKTLLLQVQRSITVT